MWNGTVGIGQAQLGVLAVQRRLLEMVAGQGRGLALPNCDARLDG